MIAVITFGLPGAGKTTYLNKYYAGWNMVSADIIKPTIAGWNPKNPSAVHQESVKLAKEAVFNFAKKRIPFVFDSGSINTRYSRNIIQQLNQAGYKIHLLVFDTSLEVCLERNAKREFQVPKEDIIAKDSEKYEAFFAIAPYCSVIEYIKEGINNASIIN